MQIDHSRPYLEIIKEQAQNFSTYPQRLVDEFERLDRALFVPEDLRERFMSRVYTDAGCAGLLSQPGVIFEMIAGLFLKGHEKILEGGTGTGYQTAILARLAREVVTIERDKKRMEAARARLDALGIKNVTFVHSDAAYGFPPFAPYDRMIFSAAIHDKVDQLLLNQMADPSRLLIPTGTYNSERRMVIGDLLLVIKREGKVTQKIIPIYGGTLSFVPLISQREIGWTSTNTGYIPS